MENVTASDAKREFGDILLKAQKAPIGISKNGKPVAVVVSAQDYAELEALRLEALRQQIQWGLDDIHAGRIQPGTKVIQGLKQRIKDADL
jgi:prevent-host-death family protein